MQPFGRVPSRSLPLPVPSAVFAEGLHHSLLQGCSRPHSTASMRMGQVLVMALSNMEAPFSHDTLDLCGLSYVSAAAEITLRMAQGSDETKEDGDTEVSARLSHISTAAFEELRRHPQQKVMDKFNRLNTAELLHGARVARGNDPNSDKVKEEEEEEEEADDDGD